MSVCVTHYILLRSDTNVIIFSSGDFYCNQKANEISIVWEEEEREHQRSPEHSWTTSASYFLLFPFSSFTFPALSSSLLFTVEYPVLIFSLFFPKEQAPVHNKQTKQKLTNDKYMFNTLIIWIYIPSWLHHNTYDTKHSVSILMPKERISLAR